MSQTFRSPSKKIFFFRLGKEEAQTLRFRNKYRPKSARKIRDQHYRDAPICLRLIGRVTTTTDDFCRGTNAYKNSKYSVSMRSKGGKNTATMNTNSGIRGRA